MRLERGACTFEEYRALRYFPNLDGLRAVAVLLVITVHMGVELYPKFWDWLHGSGGVAIFFVLSGFLITTLAVREEEERGRLNLKAFYWRRTLRIFPLYYYVVGLYTLLTLTSGGGRVDKFYDALPYYLTYMGELAPPAQLYHLWSLGIEEKFYLLWPPAGFVLLRARPRARLAVAVAAAFAPAVFEWPGWHSYSRILAGCALGLALADPRLFQKLRPLASGVAAWAGLAFVSFAHFAVVDPAWRRYPMEALYTVGIVWLLLGLTIGRPPWGRLLATRPLRYLGRRSYGMYLIHVLAIGVLEFALRPSPDQTGLILFSYVCAATLTVLAAETLYRVVERPGMIIGRRLSDEALAQDDRSASAVETRPDVAPASG